MSIKKCFSASFVASAYRVFMEQECILISDADNINSSKSLRNPYDMVERSLRTYRIIWRLFKICRMSFVSRSYNTIYGLTSKDRMYESVGGHVTLATNILKEAIFYHFDDGSGKPSVFLKKKMKGYSYHELMEVMNLHDLAEILYGDIPDNGERDEKEKNLHEYGYIKDYVNTFSDAAYSRNVMMLFESMQKQDSTLGKLLFLSDKIAAIIVTLCLDLMGDSPLMDKNSPYASERDLSEMQTCDFSTNDGFYRASEMWTIDYFRERRICELDTSGFFTGLILMATLMVHGKWYNWRISDYLTPP